MGIGECCKRSNHITSALVHSDAREDKQFLFLITHPQSYSYIVKSSNVLAVIQEIKHIRRKESSHCVLRHEYFVAINMILILCKNQRTSNTATCHSFYMIVVCPFPIDGF